MTAPRPLRPDEHTGPWAHMPRQRRRGAWIGPLLVLSLFGWLSLAHGYTPGPWVRDCWDILGEGPGTGHVCEVSIPNGDDNKYWKPEEPDDNEDGAPVHALREIAAEIDCLIDHNCTRKEMADAKALYEGAKLAGFTR